MNNSKTLMALALGSCLLACPALALAQQDQESVADAARKAQAQRKNAPPAKLVVDNDSLGELKGTVNVVGETPGSDQTKTDDKTKTGDKVKDEAYWRQQFAGAYGKLAADSKELDITQRERNLNQQQYYTDPMASLKQDYSRKDLNDEKTKIDDLTARVAQDKADISTLEDQLRQSGGDPGWASPPSQSDNGSGAGASPAAPASSAPAAPSAPPPPSSSAPAAGSSPQ